MFSQYKTSTAQVNDIDEKQYQEMIKTVLDSENGGKDVKGKYEFKYDIYTQACTPTPCLTHQDAKKLAEFLTSKNIPCERVTEQAGMQEFDYFLRFDTNKNRLIDQLNEIFPAKQIPAKQTYSFF